MTFLTKIRGLYRFDGDDEPGTVSRRSFIFLSGVVLAGAALPGNRVLATCSGASTTHHLPVYDSATGLPTDVLLVVTDVDYVRGVITLDSMTVGEYLCRSPLPIVEERGKTFDDMKPGSVITKQDYMLADVIDQTRHPHDECWLTQNEHFRIMTPPNRVESWMRRMTSRDRPGGRTRS